MDVLVRTGRDGAHHVILFRVPPAAWPKAEAMDAEEDGEGWTCFGGQPVVGTGDQLGDARGSARGRRAGERA